MKRRRFTLRVILSLLLCAATCALKRRIFAVLAVLSLLLCMATCVLWVRSYWVWDLPVLTALRLEGNDGRWVGLEFSSVNGGLGLFTKIHHFGTTYFDAYR
jgi:hypothetical protein